MEKYNVIFESEKMNIKIRKANTNDIDNNL